MTKAMYKIGKTFKEMVKLHNKEIKNHECLIKQFERAADKTKGFERRLIYLAEAQRNREHQEGHKKIKKFYENCNRF